MPLVDIRPQVCAECSAALPAARATGRPRRYCSARCRQKARRRRSALPWPPIAPAHYPVDPLTVSRRTAEAIVATLEGERAAPAVDQLAQGLLEIDWIVYRLAALERDLPRRLAGRAAELARRIREARMQLFPEAAA